MDLVSSFRLIFRVCQIFGIAPYRWRKRKHRNQLLESHRAMLYTKIVFLVCISGVMTLFVNLPSHFNSLLHVPSKVAKTVFFLIFSANVCCLYVTVIAKRGLILRCSDLINETCSGKAFEDLAAFNRNLVLWYTSLHCAVNGVSLSQKLSTFANLRLAQMFEWIFLSVWSLPEDFFICQMMCFTNLANFKFQRMNEKLKREGETLEPMLKLRALREEDILVKDYVDLLTEVYQYNLLFQTCQLFMASLSLTFEMMLDDNEKFHAVGFLAYVLSRLIPVLSLFESTRKEADKTANYVHELFLDNDDPSINEEIEIFSLQLQHRKLQFNACGFFNLDFTLLYSMIGAVATYIVILMQFQKEDPSTDWRARRPSGCPCFCNGVPLNASEPAWRQSAPEN